MQTDRPVDLLDEIVAKHRPFADSAYLQEQLHARYAHRLLKISEEVPAAGALMRALAKTDGHTQYATFGDPVLRHTIQQTLRRIVAKAVDTLPPDVCEGVFRATLQHLEDGKAGSPTEGGNRASDRLGPEPCHGWIWSEQHADDVFGRVFRRMVHDNYRGDPVCSPDDADVSKLKEGRALLETVLPSCSRSVLSHAHVIVIVPNIGSWTQTGSCSEFALSGMIFMNREMLSNPWWVAEHLLHEALHQKLYDFRHTHSLLARDLSPHTYPCTEKAEVRPIWNAARVPGSDRWDTFRALAAFHVYVYLAVFSVLAERRRGELVARFGGPDALEPAVTTKRDALERSHYLGKQLRENCWQELGQAGRLLVDWLFSLLCAIDASPPPAESLFLRQLLNRYLTEAVILSRKSHVDVSARTDPIVSTEAEAVRGVIRATTGSEADVNRLNVASVRREEEEPGVAFLRFRSAAAGILLSLSSDGYGFRRAPLANGATVEALENTVRSMIERSSEKLASALVEGQQTPASHR